MMNNEDPRANKDRQDNEASEAPKVKTPASANSPIKAVELQEYLVSNTAAQMAAHSSEVAIRQNIREILRMHRFTVMTYLMSSGVPIPMEFLNDQAHPVVGEQTPDKPAAHRCPSGRCRQEVKCGKAGACVELK